MATNFPAWQKPVAHGPEMTRKYRRDVPFQIETCGLDRAGRFFTERTETSEVSESGCKFKLKTEIAPGAIVAVRALAGHDGGAELLRPVLFRAIRLERNAAGWHVATVQLQRDEPWTAGLLKADG